MIDKVLEKAFHAYMLTAIYASLAKEYVLEVLTSWIPWPRN